MQDRAEVVPYPARFILSAVRRRVGHTEVVAYQDACDVHNDQELTQRITLYRHLEELGGLPLVMRLVPADKVEAGIREDRARREFEAGLGDGPPKVCLSCEAGCDYQFQAEYAEECQKAIDAREAAEERAAR